MDFKRNKNWKDKGFQKKVKLKIDLICIENVLMGL